MATSNASTSVDDARQISIAWLDANVCNKENDEILQRLGELFKPCMGFTEQSECVRFLGRGVHDPRQFIVIVSGALGEELVSDIHGHENVLSIYVYCGRVEKHKKWGEKYSKVKVLDNPDDLLDGVKADKQTYKST